MPAPITATPDVLERITQTIVARLEGISRENGYSLDVASVLRPKRNGLYIDSNGDQQTIENQTIVVTQGPPVPDDALSAPGNPPRQAWLQPFELGLYVLDSDNSRDPIERMTSYFVADVRKAICTPQDTWHIFDDLAINAAFGAPQPMLNEDGKVDGVVCQLLVSYRTPENDPYTAA